MDIMSLLAAKMAGGGGVSSWNDIPDKPDSLPYMEKVYGEILPEAALEQVYPDDGMAVIPGDLGLKEGRTYTVKYNGTEYIRTAQFFSADGVGFVYIGDVSFVAGGEPTGDPFCIAYGSDIVGMFGVLNGMIFNDGSTSITLGITGEMDIIHPLDTRCLYTTVYLTSNGNGGYISSLTFEQMVEGIKNGKRYALECRATNGDTVACQFATLNSYYIGMPEGNAIADQLVFGTNIPTGAATFICWADSTWSVKGY